LQNEKPKNYIRQNPENLRMVCISGWFAGALHNKEKRVLRNKAKSTNLITIKLTLIKGIEIEMGNYV